MDVGVQAKALGADTGVGRVLCLLARECQGGLSRSALSGRREVRGRCGRLRLRRAEGPGRDRARNRQGTPNKVQGEVRALGRLLLSHEVYLETLTGNRNFKSYFSTIGRVPMRRGAINHTIQGSEKEGGRQREVKWARLLGQVGSFAKVESGELIMLPDSKGY